MQIFLASLLLALLLAASGCSRLVPAALEIDPAVQEEIRRTSAIDNHAHPLRVVAAGEHDVDYDALPGDTIADPALPTPFRPGSPLFPEAWHALFNYQFSDAQPEHIADLTRARQALQQQKGDLYPSWVLNQAKTDIMLANRVAMGRGLAADRFRWVPFVDMFLFPLNNTAFKNRDPEHRSFVSAEEVLLARHLSAAGLHHLPPTLDDYLTFLSHTLSNWKSQNAVAVKFEFAYLRDLQISAPPRESAERVYSIYAQSSEPSLDDYKLLQDFLFRYLALESGRLALPVHIHSSLGAGSYFQTSNGNPLPLQSLFNDPALRKTKFVLLHGAWPFSREAAALILKPNVYVDYSAFAYLTYPVEGAKALRLYLEAAPEHVLYGSDASPFDKNVSWEETAWLGSQIGRQTLGIALTGMLHDGEISVARAKELARLVLRGNAQQLYSL